MRNDQENGDRKTVRDTTKCKEIIGRKNVLTKQQQESLARYPEVLKRYEAAMKKWRTTRPPADPNCKKCAIAQKLGVVIGCECLG